jgi:hypothetical protein
VVVAGGMEKSPRTSVDPGPVGHVYLERLLVVASYLGGPLSLSDTGG